MSQLDSYLFFDGNCAEAMRFYERTCTPASRSRAAS